MVARGRSSLAPPSFSFPYTSPWDDRDRQLCLWIFVSEPSAEIVCLSAVGYSDFHNLMGFTSKKMPKNILKNVC
jgi:hypothetical protein